MENEREEGEEKMQPHSDQCFEDMKRVSLEKPERWRFQSEKFWFTRCLKATESSMTSGIIARQTNIQKLKSKPEQNMPFRRS